MSNRTMDQIDEAPFEHHILTEVTEYDGDGYGLDFSGMGAFLSTEHGVVPHVGDNVYFYMDGPFRAIRGIAINGVVAFYRTREQQQEKNASALAEHNRKRIEKFEEVREDHDRRIAALPEPFRRRLAYFQRTPDWRWQYEDYELFCCEQAVLIAAAVPDPERITEFQVYDWQALLDAVPGLSGDHSGNTFGFSCALAKIYLKEPDLVPDFHGAMVPLAGCEEYGCEHPRPWRKEAA